MEVTAVVKLQIGLKKANPAPPIGSSLGPKGVNLPAFCKQFNDVEMEGYEVGTPIPVIVTVYKDKSFKFVVKTPPTPYLILKAAGIAKGAKNPTKDVAGQISVSKIAEIAKKKMIDMNSENLEACIRMVKGTAYSMGIKVVES